MGKRLALLFMVCATWAYSQNSIQLSANNKPLSAVLEQLEDDYDYSFSYASDAIKDSIVTVAIHASKIEDVLDALFYGSIEYRILNKNILIRNRETPYSSSNETLHLRGKITDNNGQALPYATIQLLDSDIGTYTDDEGIFHLEIPGDTQSRQLEVSFVGYTSSQLELREIEDEYLLLHLTPCEYAIESIVIANRKKPIRNISTDQSIILSQHFIGQNTSSLMGADVARALQLLSGISATDDTSTDLKIRGSNADETLMILDGMPLYHTSHYYGVFSNINANYLDQATLYKNNIPTHYGGKTAGVVRLESTDNIVTGTTGTATLDLMNIQANVTLPIHNKAQLSVAGRSTWDDISNSQFNTFSNPSSNAIKVDRFESLDASSTSNPTYGFYDLNAKVLIKPNTSSSWDINYFQSSDGLANNASTTIENKVRTKIQLGITENASWNSKAGSIRYHRQLDKARSITATSFLTHHDQSENLSFQLSRRRFSSKVDTMRKFGLEQSNRITDIGFKLQAQYDNTQLGTEIIHHNVDYLLTENEEQLLSNHHMPWEAAGFGSYKITSPDKSLATTIGARATWYTGNNTLYLSPRLQATYHPQEHWLVKGSIGLYQQFVRQFHYDYRSMEKSFWVAANKSTIPVLQSTNTMIGTTVFWNNWKVDIEAYYKDIYGVQDYAVTKPTERSHNNKARDYRLFIGDGRVRGIDVEVSSSWNNLQSALHYTLSKAEHKYAEIARNRYLPSEDDRRHELKWINAYTYNNFTLGANIIYASGRPYTDLRAILPRQDIRNKELRSKRLPDYYRLDFSAQYSLAIRGNTALDIGLSLYNAFDHKNVKYVQSIVSNVRQDKKEVNAIIGNQAALLGRTINISAQFRW